MAAFSRARLGRLFLVQALVLLVHAGVLFWFLHTAWFPTIRASIRNLPETGQLENQQLVSPRTSIEPLVENRFMAFVIDVNEVGAPHLPSDLQFEFRSRRLVLCSFLGCRSFDYRPEWQLPLNRPELESGWQAWEPMIYVTMLVGSSALIFVSWLLLATLYSPFVRLYAFFKDRELSFFGSWKLCCAALLPGCLLLSLSLLLYGLGTIGLIRLCCLWLLHLVLGWVYAAVSPSRLPRAGDAVASAQQNPFGDADEKAKPEPNPFVASKS